MNPALEEPEKSLRSKLLDLLCTQWRALGVPFVAAELDRASEVIDPEALLWCTLEFTPTEPRLLEGVRAWLDEQPKTILKARWKRGTRASDPRASIWSALNGRVPRAVEPELPCLGLSDVEQLHAFCAALEGEGQRGAWIGEASDGDPTALLRARDLLGDDARHLIVLYLLGRPGGARTRDIAEWSRYSDRNIAETLSTLEKARAIRSRRGLHELVAPAPWGELFGCGVESLRIVDWFSFYDACVDWLRTLERARRKGIDPNGIVLTTARARTEELVGYALGRRRIDAATPLGQVVAQLDRAHA